MEPSVFLFLFLTRGSASCRDMEEVVPAYFAGTTNALKKGVTKMSADAAIKKIEAWEDALEEVEVPVHAQILRDFGALKRQLGQDEPDGERIRTILARLADATVRSRRE